MDKLDRAATDKSKATAPITDDGELIQKLNGWVEESDSGNFHNRESSEEDVRFYLGREEDQWDSQALQNRKAAKLPCLTINKLGQSVRSVTGNIRKHRYSISVLPAGMEGNEATAKVYEGLIRQIQYASIARRALSVASDQSVQGGEGFFRVCIEDNPQNIFEQHLAIRPIYNQFSVYYDPSSFEPDFSDARYVVVTEWLSRDEFRDRFPDASESSHVGTGISGQDRSPNDRNPESPDDMRIGEAFWREYEDAEYALLSTGEVIDITGKDNDKLAAWLEKSTIERYMANGLSEEDIAIGIANNELDWISIVDRRRKKRPVLMHVLFSNTELLTKKKKWPGGDVVPIVRVSGDEVFIDGRRHTKSVIRDAKDSQRAYNYTTSQTIGAYALAPKNVWLVPFKAIAQWWDLWTNANSGNVPFLPYKSQPGHPKPERQPAPQIDQAGMALGAQATNDIKETTGIHEAMLGERSNEKSGRAIRERKAQSATGTQVWADNYEIAIECAGKILVSLIPHVYGHAEAAIVLDENLERAYLQQLRGTMVLKDNNEEAYEEPIDLNVGQYQVKVAVGPTFASQREEAQSFIIDTMQALPPEVAGIIAPLVVKYSDQPGSDEIMNEMAPVVEALKIRMGVGGPEAQSQLQAMAMQSTMQALVQLQIIPPEMAEQLMQQMAGGGQQGAEGEVA